MRSPLRRAILHDACMLHADKTTARSGFASTCFTLNLIRYTQKEFQFGEVTVPLLVSPSACTDFDLTGEP